MVTSTWRVLLRVLPSCSRRAVGSIRPRAISTSQENQSRDHTAEEVPEDRIRNFSIVAHVDHGKSTLADRLLEITNTVSLSESVPQLLDQLPVERERGITVKAQTATMYHEYNGHTYMLNLIDTPGHVDFSYEVSRSLAACHGVVLLVDAQQGVQAQTVANFLLSTEAELTVLPAINKIDLKLADVDATIEQMNSVFGFTSEKILKVSAKLGTGVPHLLNEIIDRIPCPPGSRSSPLKMLLFDSWYDKYRGVVCLVAVQDGVVKPGDLVSSMHTESSYKVMEVGLLRPKQSLQHSLGAGQVGYLILGMRVMSEAHIGDTLHHTHTAVKPAAGFKPAQPMVFAGLYPTEQSELPVLRSSLEKLCLNDRSVMVKIESSVALGQGWRLGFLGLLHMEVFTQRLEEEFGTSVILTSPSVPCKAILKTGEEVTILNPAQFPPSYQVDQYLEPIVTGTIVLPDQYLGKVIRLCEERRGVQKEMLYLDSSRILLKYELPLVEVVVDFYHQLKTITSGYGSFDYEDSGYQPAKLVKLNILLNGVEVDALSSIVHTSKAYSIGKKICAKLKETIHRQLFEIAIQAASGSRVIARETVRALRKDVTAKCYGGDMSRRMKLLKRQKEGKKRLRSIGKVELSKQAFLAVLER